MRKISNMATLFGAGFLALALGCAKPPTIEVTDAENAVNAAEQAGALEYASLDFQAAKDALADAKAKIESKDYKAALASALDAKAKAESASAAVEPGKLAAKAEAQAGIEAIDAKVKDLETFLKKKTTKASKETKASLEALKADFVKVNEDFLQGNYMKALSATKLVQGQLDDISAKAGVPAKTDAKK
jgi:uncharacterized protein YPO0396